MAWKKSEKIGNILNKMSYMIYKVDIENISISYMTYLIKIFILNEHIFSHSHDILKVTGIIYLMSLNKGMAEQRLEEILRRQASLRSAKNRKLWRTTVTPS